MMGDLIMCCLFFVGGVLLGSLSSSDATIDQINQANNLCQNNGGLRVMKVSSVGPVNVVCQNSAVFTLQ